MLSINTRNFVDLIACTSIYSGEEYNPCPYYPPKSRAHMYVATTGSTRYRLNLHHQDNGHTAVIGPPGAGKSTLVANLEAQFFAYPDAQVMCLDYGYSHYAITRASGGQHFAIGGDDDTTLTLCPLAYADQPQERLWLLSYFETLLTLDGLSLTPAQRNELERALERVGAGKMRRMTDLMIEVQDATLKAALEPYTAGQPLGRLLDAEADHFPAGQFLTFELSHLFALDERFVAPVLLLLFHAMNRRLDGNPTLIVWEELWISVFNSLYARMLEEMLRVARKRNAAIIFTTQSLADVSSMSRLDTLLRACPTKILLANGQASHGEREFYRRLGLSDAEVQLISEMLPKQDYYITQPLGRRCFQLELGPVGLAFTGVDGADVKLRIDALIAEHGEAWPAAWLRERGLGPQADEWLALYKERNKR